MKKFNFFQKISSMIADSKMVFAKSKVIKTVSLSVIGFSCSALITLGVFGAVDKYNNRKGVGGLETTGVTEYEENLENFLAERDEDEAASPAEAVLQSEENQNENANAVSYQTYRVKAGDMIGFIADKYNVTQDTIISVNNIKQSRLIQVGQYLKIPSMPGIIYTVRTDGETPSTIAQKYEVSATECALVNSLQEDEKLKAGVSLFVPNAELDWVTRQEINGDLFHKPLHVRYWLSSNYGWRDSPFNAGKRTFHGGIDMAVASGTPIYAALDGRVTATGYNSTYGNYVIITHHSGYKTLYGHMSQITCKKGNFVYTNTMIGRVGSTGMSTGPHLHFTVYKNGKTVNPNTLLN